MWYVGLPDVDLDDLRANTEYQGYKATDPQVEFFWSVYSVYSICMLYIHHMLSVEHHMFLFILY